MRCTKFIIIAAAAVIVFAFGLTAAQRERAKAPAEAATAAIKFEAVQPQTRKYIEYYKTIRLTPAQEQIKTAALSPLKAV